jgi:hypothetical protein
VGRENLTVRFADVDLAARVTEAIEREWPEGNHPFHIEVAGTSDGQVAVRVWNNQGVFVSMGSGPIESAGPHKARTVTAAIATIRRALGLARWQWLNEQGGANAKS